MSFRKPRDSNTDSKNNGYNNKADKTTTNNQVSSNSNSTYNNGSSHGRKASQSNNKAMDIEPKSTTASQIHSPQKNRTSHQKNSQGVVLEYDTFTQNPYETTNSAFYAPRQVINAYKQEHVQAQKTIYYMEAAYTRVLDTFQENIDFLLAGVKKIDDGILKLNILIDNTFIQFQAAEKNFPDP